MDSKSIYPHIVRAAFAGAMLFAISMANVDVFGTDSMGLRFFELVCTLNVFIITISGITYFVTAVTEEKDAGTFALLRLAGMNSLSITLGKSTSRLVSSLMLLVIQIPFTFLSITLGGVLWNQIIAAYLALAAWMILVANLALFCSVRCATSGRAAGLAATTIGVFVFLPRISSAFLGAISPGVLSAGTIAFLEAIPAACSKISVFDRLAEILGLTSGFKMLGIDFSTGLTTISTASIKGEVSIVAGQFWSSLLAAFVLFVISTLTLDLWCAPTDIAGPSENKSIRRWAMGRCWNLPVAWKEFLFFTGGRAFAIAKFVAGGLAFAGFRMFQEMDGYSNGLVLRGDYSWWAFLTFVFTLTAEVLLYSSGCLFYEVRQQTQSTLATVPISSVRILVEKFAGCAIALVPALVWIFITLILSDGAIARNCSATMVSSYLIMLGFASHLAALLSLYTRWAALPLTILLAMPAFFCMAAPILGLTAVTSVFARSHNVEVTLLLSSIINLFWTWMFVLLPLQIWIRDRWIALSQQ
jgi:hypothetical protein